MLRASTAENIRFITIDIQQLATRPETPILTTLAHTQKESDRIMKHLSPVLLNALSYAPSPLLHQVKQNVIMSKVNTKSRKPLLMLSKFLTHRPTNSNISENNPEVTTNNKEDI
ncbi:unnamed protein product [Lactuca saligna]|uniref:Uncharacterized protein n=1 Tax=Lactuca saligna TaxID=75948 RepID=A0AA35Y8R9_LACSI|nr:unnamed protein product [Lactuca saligna]